MKKRMARSRYNIKTLCGEFQIWFCNYVVAFVPSHSVRNWFYRSVMRYEIAQGASILIGCKFNCKDSFSIGRNSIINQGCHLDNRGGIYIGDNVSISPYVSIVTADHDINSPNFEGCVKSVVIEDCVFIGYRALVLKGIVLQVGSVVAAAACQSKTTEPFGIYAGVPSKLVSTRSDAINYQLTYRRLFH